MNGFVFETNNTRLSLYSMNQGITAAGAVGIVDCCRVNVAGVKTN
jgi:hypothetical protein